jgi:fluoride exporter
MLQNLLVVIIGSGIGGGLRFLISSALPWNVSGYPWATLLVNIIGCFLLGVISGLAIRSTVLNRTTLLLLGTGLCGGFTTFSTFSMEMVDLLRTDQVGIALAYLAGSVVGGFLSAALGVVLVRHATP